MEIRNQYGTLVVINKDRGRNVTCKCNRCGAIGEYDKYWLEKKYSEDSTKIAETMYCRNCKKFKGIEIGKTNKKGFQIVGYAQDKNGELLVNALHTKCNREMYMYKEEFTEGKVACKFCEAKEKARQKIGTDIQEVKGINLYGNKPRKVSVDRYKAEKDNRRLEENKTKKDKIELIDKLKTKGLLKADLSGRIFNGLRILKCYTYDKVYRCNVECIHCGTKQTCDLLDLIAGKILCKNTVCSMEPERIVCPHCEKKKFQTREGWMGKGLEGGAISINRKDLYLGKTLKCPVCGKTIYLSDIAYKHDLNSFLEESLASMNRDKYGNFGKVDPLTKLAQCREVVYTGRDGKARFNCFCVEHRKHLCLTLDDIRAYAHEYCDCEYMTSIEQLPKKIVKKQEDDPAYF